MVLKHLLLAASALALAALPVHALAQNQQQPHGGGGGAPHGAACPMAVGAVALVECLMAAVAEVTSRRRRAPRRRWQDASRQRSRRQRRAGYRSAGGHTGRDLYRFAHGRATTGQRHRRWTLGAYVHDADGRRRTHGDPDQSHRRLDPRSRRRAWRSRGERSGSHEPISPRPCTLNCAAGGRGVGQSWRAAPYGAATATGGAATRISAATTVHGPAHISRRASATTPCRAAIEVHRWGVGEFLPLFFLSYTLADWVDYGLPPPPPGCAWVWVGAQPPAHRRRPTAMSIDEYSDVF